MLKISESLIQFDELPLPSGKDRVIVESADRILQQFRSHRDDKKNDLFQPLPEQK